MSGIEIRCMRRIRKGDLLRSSVDLVAVAADQMITDLARGAIESIKKESARFTRKIDAIPFRDDVIAVEVAATIIPTGELAYLESRARECERERQWARDLTAKINIAEARRRIMRRRGR